MGNGKGCVLGLVAVFVAGCATGGDAPQLAHARTSVAGIKGVPETTKSIVPDSASSKDGFYEEFWPSTPKDDTWVNETFGVGTYNESGVAAVGYRPVLTVLIDFDDVSFRPEHTTGYYKGLLFGYALPSVYELYAEMTGGLFNWSMGGFVSAVRATDNPATPCDERQRACATAGVNWFATVRRAIRDTATRGLVDYSHFDTNADGNLSPDELQVIVIDAGGEGGGAVRDMGCVDVSPMEGPSLQSCGRRASFGEAAGVATIAHELAHTLGIWVDLYNDLAMPDSDRLTLMSSNGSPVHLDPFLKMKLGWTRPVVYDLSEGPGTCIEQAVASLPVDGGRPILLYDSRRGTSEYFMLEYRAKVGHDTYLPGEGVAVWHVKLRSDGSVFQIRGRSIYSGPNGRIDSVIDPRDIAIDSVWGSIPDGRPDLIAAGLDQVLDSVPSGDDEYSRRNMVMTRGVPSVPGAAPDLGGNRLWREEDGAFRLQWIDSADREVPAMSDAGVVLRVGHKMPGQNSVAVQWWTDAYAGANINRTSLAQCLDDVLSISAGTAHSCSLTREGHVYCSGNNGNGALGDGTGQNKSTPVHVLSDERFSQVSASNEFTCALTSDGVPACWGSNAQGRLGLGDQVVRYAPTRLPMSGVSKIATGRDHACAIMLDGTVQCWGANAWGQLGVGDRATRLVATPVVGLTNIVSLALGATHSCATDVYGRAYCWGSNANGELGLGDTTVRTTPTALGLSGVSQLALGQDFSCALLSTGDVYCWGTQSYGQLGESSGRAQSLPVRARVSAVTSLSAGNAHVCAISAGSVYCWGNGADGALGNGSTLGRSLPTLVPGLLASSVSAGRQHTCVSAYNGAILCTGRNPLGQLGDGTSLQRLGFSSSKF